jgi:hypothetical protein
MSAGIFDIKVSLNERTKDFSIPRRLVGRVPRGGSGMRGAASFFFSEAKSI